MIENFKVQIKLIEFFEFQQFLEQSRRGPTVIEDRGLITSCACIL